MIYSKEVLDVFLANQLKLFPEKVADDYEEADEFLDMVCATVVNNKKELKDYLSDNMDISDFSDDTLDQIEEVFTLSNGKYLIVEG